jgi:hypothetical protein
MPDRSDSRVGECGCEQTIVQVAALRGFEFGQLAVKLLLTSGDFLSLGGLKLLLLHYPLTEKGDTILLLGSQLGEAAGFTPLLKF